MHSSTSKGNDLAISDFKKQSNELHDTTNHKLDEIKKRESHNFCHTHRIKLFIIELKNNIVSEEFHLFTQSFQQEY